MWAVLGGRDERPLEDAVPLRLLGGMHREVLRGTAGSLADHYPSTGGEGDAIAAARLVLRFLGDPPPGVLDALTRTPQTNEVGRLAALTPGFQLVAHDTGLPLRLLETGTSAGLNLRVDQYRFEHAGSTWGPAGASVRLVDLWTTATPPFDASVRIVDRRGCDIDPMDAADPETALRLLSYVWPGQVERFEALRSALDVARDHPVTIDQVDAADWVGRQLADPVPGVATIVFHSSFWQYLDDDRQARYTAAVHAAGTRATADAPVALLGLEAAEGGHPNELRVRLWDGRPGGGRAAAPRHDRVLRRSGRLGRLSGRAGSDRHDVGAARSSRVDRWRLHRARNAALTPITAPASTSVAQCSSSTSRLAITAATTSVASTPPAPGAVVRGAGCAPHEHQTGHEHGDRHRVARREHERLEHAGDVATRSGSGDEDLGRSARRVGDEDGEHRQQRPVHVVGPPPHGGGRHDREAEHDQRRRRGAHGRRRAEQHRGVGEHPRPGGGVDGGSRHGGAAVEEHEPDDGGDDREQADRLEEVDGQPDGRRGHDVRPRQVVGPGPGGRGGRRHDQSHGTGITVTERCDEG